VISWKTGEGLPLINFASFDQILQVNKKRPGFISKAQ
jgi:hypothetical protein